jgi:hypothetical protein
MKATKENLYGMMDDYVCGIHFSRVRQVAAIRNVENSHYKNYICHSGLYFDVVLLSSNYTAGTHYTPYPLGSIL